MKKLALVLSIFLTISASAQTDIKNQFVKYLTDSSKISLYDMDPNAGFTTSDSMTVCKISEYNRLAVIQHRSPGDLDRLEESLRDKNIAYDREVYVFEGDFVYGSSVPISGSGKGVNSNYTNKKVIPFATFTYYKEDGNTVLVVVQARNPKDSLF
jgi:hypothetical protein